jgi:hypothetical protein
MLRNRLFKRFAKNGIEEPVDKISNAGLDPIQQYPTLEELTSKMKPITPSMMGKGIPKTEEQYETNSGELSINAKSFESKAIDPIEEKGPFGNRMFENMFNQEQTLRAGEEQTSTPSSVKKAQNISDEVASQYDPKKQFKFPNLGIDPGDAITLGLYGVDAALTYNQDLENQRKFNESIQQRNSKPVYDYNYMYGRTTSGGTEYQPTIKAEMGAKINKRYASEGMNDVEIEGGEFIQLPNLDTEMAEGPSHSNGGIPTNLPDETRVYSNNLKPEGSKKTFAQIAKNYDTTSYKKTLENPFAKQVDKDTASLMMQRNQRILDDLFRDQQILNGDSNGEVEAKNGASINNAGFKALPQSVQDKILAEMKYGGFAQREAQSLEMVDGGTPPSKAGIPKNLQEYVNWDPQAGGGKGAWRLEVPEGLPSSKLKEIAAAANTQGYKNLVQTSNPRLKGQSAKYEGYYAGLTPQDYERRIVEEELGPDATTSMDELGIRKKAFELVGINPNDYNIEDPTGLYNSKDFRQKFYQGFTKYLPEGQFRPDLGNDFRFGFEHYDAIKGKPKDPQTTGTTPVKPTNIPTYNPVTGGVDNKYIRGEFPLYQAIPEAMGYAQAQEIYPYAIPEIDAPYVRPQTLNIQSELQDIDNMGTSTMRAGADPLQVYIAGLDAKQKAFQAKQNYDAQARSQADMANAEMSFSADRLNQGAFDQVYNNLVGQARDAQSAEKQAAIASLTTKKGLFDQEENVKDAFITNLITNFDVDSKGNFKLKPSGNFSYSNPTTAKKGMYKK